MSVTREQVNLLVLDLDNTIWDWLGVWAESFTAMLDELVRKTGWSAEDLKNTIRKIHQSKGTSEYSFLLDDILNNLQSENNIKMIVDEAQHKLNSVRFHKTVLFPGVLSTLKKLKNAGVPVVAYTESGAYWAKWRILHTNLDGMVDQIYANADHEIPISINIDEVRTKPSDSYKLKHAKLSIVNKEITKPDPFVLYMILNDYNVEPRRTVYVGDSLSKDIKMANKAGVISVYAAYGAPRDQSHYRMLKEVTHWSDDQIVADNSAKTETIIPDYILNSSFSELLELFDFTRGNCDYSKK